MTETTQRVNFRMGKDLYLWYKKEAEKMGVPMGALMALSLQQQAAQLQTITAMTRVMEIEEEKNAKN